MKTCKIMVMSKMLTEKLDDWYKCIKCEWLGHKCKIWNWMVVTYKLHENVDCENG